MSDPTLFDDNDEPDPLPPVPWWARDLSLIQAQEVLRGLLDDGTRCPCCGQLAKIYKRRVHATMARGLIMMHRAAPSGDWFYLPDVLRALGRSRGGDEAKCVYWGLIEEDPAGRDDGSSRAGWWRVTELGRRFTFGYTSIPKYARIYDGRCLGFEGDLVDIRDALGAKFNYRALMDGEA